MRNQRHPHRRRFQLFFCIRIRHLKQVDFILLPNFDRFIRFDFFRPFTATIGIFSHPRDGIEHIGRTVNPKSVLKNLRKFIIDYTNEPMLI